MGRLTKKFEDGNGNVKCFASCRSCNGCICSDAYTMIDKLAHYEDMEEQGRLIELPCAVGDTVWDIYEAVANGLGIDGIKELHCSSEQISLRINKRTNSMEMLIEDYWIPIKDFGKTVFLTKEEAEAKLKELEGVK